MGILNRTPDSFYDKGSYFGFDEFLRRAEEVVEQGADIADIGGVKAGPGEPVSLQEELDRVVPAVAALADRFDIAISVDTWNSEVARASYEAGAVLGNDISGFADPLYLAQAASAKVGVVATHIRLAPRVADPDPRYADLHGEVVSFLSRRVSDAIKGGVDPRSVVVDAGLDLGKTPQQSLELLRSTDRLARALNVPLLISASNKTFLGAICGGDVDGRRASSLAAASLAVWKGARIIRAHDVAGTRRLRDTLHAVMDGS